MCTPSSKSAPYLQPAGVEVYVSPTKNLRHVSRDEWFDTFDARKLNFLYQEERNDGNQSPFFRLESPDREDG